MVSNSANWTAGYNDKVNSVVIYEDSMSDDEIQHEKPGKKEDITKPDKLDKGKTKED